MLRHLRGELEVPPSKDYLRQEIDNIIAACNEIAERILGGRAGALSIAEIRQYNRLVLRHLPKAEEVEPGEFRRHRVGVGRYPGAPPEDVEFLTDRLCRWLDEEFRTPDGHESHEIAFGILRAVLAHLYIAWIHPFGDGNGRTARLLELRILLSVGVPGVAAHLLSNHYNQTRSEYYRLLDLAHQRGGDPLPFVEYALQGFVDGLQQQIEVIKEQQLDVHWVNYIHDVFRDQDTKAAVRRRRLAIDLSHAGEAVAIGKVRHLSPRLAEAYASKTDKTIKRDLNALEKLGLIRRTAGGFRTRKETIRAFLPAVTPEPSQSL